MRCLLVRDSFERSRGPPLRLRLREPDESFFLVEPPLWPWMFIYDLAMKALPLPFELKLDGVMF